MNAATMPALWTGSELTLALGGQGSLALGATGISFDSRTLSPGDLFFAIRGEQRDGHARVADALARGASAAVVAHAVDNLPAAAPLIWVEDTLAALTRLGAAGRARFRGTAIAVTGSVGKTTSKDALKHALSAQGPTHASPASFNNFLGVPVTLASIPRAAKFLAAEIGMNHRGEIAPLARLARPHVALITSVEAVHVGHFGSVAAIAEEKADILLGLDDGGTAVLPADNPHIGYLTKRAEDAGADRILTFGERDCHVRLVGFEGAADSATATVRVLGREQDFRIGAPGRHVALNLCAVLACILAAGADWRDAAASFATFAPGTGRGGRRSIGTSDGGTALLLDESYNASVPSMRAALAVLAAQPAKRRIAVLGDMLELGEAGPAMHESLAEHAAAADLVFTCGPLMRHLHDALPQARRGAHAKDSAAIAPIVAEALRDGDAVTVKGSLGSRMKLVVAALDARSA